jgi:hypothetical protein
MARDALVRVELTVRYPHGQRVSLHDTVEQAESALAVAQMLATVPIVGHSIVEVK